MKNIRMTPTPKASRFTPQFDNRISSPLIKPYAQACLNMIDAKAMTATNSFTTLDFARELVDCQPDLYIVYDGHNEFYGALGVASRESPGTD